MSNQGATVRSGLRWKQSPLWPLAALLVVIFGVLFARNINPASAHFANDGPIGTLLARPYQLPDSYRGIWNDLLWLGGWNGNFNPNITGLSLGLFGREYYHKWMIPIGLIFLGLSAGFCARCFRFPRWVCVLVGLAAALNMNVFSNACWGLPSRAHAMGAAFLALAAYHACSGRFAFAKAIVAGFALGLGIAEGGDNGAIFAMVAGFYGLFHLFTCGSDTPSASPARPTRWRAFGTSFGLISLSAIAALIFSAQTLNIFVNTSVKGVAGMTDDSRTAEQKWDFATQGSLQPVETLRVIIPGLFGYRMDAEDGGNYWGRVGESLFAPGTSRHSGAGEHAGVIVVLIALWSIQHSWRRDGAFTTNERQHIWFWGAAAFICLLLAWGKWGPLYRLLYALPYFNTIRLPLKWMHPFHLSLLILFGYGLVGLGRRYFNRTTQPTPSRSMKKTAPHLPQISWWSKALGAERGWVITCLGMTGLAILGALVYGSSEKELADYLTHANVTGDPIKMAAFSVAEVRLFVFFALLSVLAMLTFLGGLFTGRTVLAASIVALLFGADLIRANQHWMLFFNYAERYALNPPLAFLKEHTQGYRVARVPTEPLIELLREQAKANSGNVPILQQLQNYADTLQQGLNYVHEQWQQNQFPYYNIPCLDLTQDPRPAVDKQAFNKAMAQAAIHGHPTRQYEMTSTRYFAGCVGDADRLNTKLDATAQRFRELLRFSLIPSRPDSQLFGDLRVQANPDGPYALLEFTGAHSRARLYSRWEVVTNESAVLTRLGSSEFDPARTLLIDEPSPVLPVLPPDSPTAQDAGSVEILPSDTSHRVVAEVNATQPGVLLLSDHFDSAWRATVDRQAAPILRCNYLMRGVPVSAGKHTVEFVYCPSMRGFWLMATCDTIGLALCGFLAAFDRKEF